MSQKPRSVTTLLELYAASAALQRAWVAATDGDDAELGKEIYAEGERVMELIAKLVKAASERQRAEAAEQLSEAAKTAETLP